MLIDHNLVRDDLNPLRTFGNVLLIPGPFHIEINMVKGLFKLLWDVLIKDLASILGFRSSRALETCRKAADHHKSWQIIEIILWGTGRELLVPFVRDCIERNVAADFDTFSSWIGQPHLSRNYKFLVDVVFTYVLALYCYRAAVRKGHTALARESFHRFADLFFVLNMTHYTELFIREYHGWHSAPAPIQDFLDSTYSYSASGSDNSGEGGDFILEGRNRRIQRWMPPGLPSDNHWRGICRNLDGLENIRAHLQMLFSENLDEDVDRHTPCLKEEINQWRRHLRRSGYIMDPFDSEDKHVTLSKQPLHHSLHLLISHCREQKTEYLQRLREGASLGARQRLQRLVILDEEVSDDE